MVTEPGNFGSDSVSEREKPFGGSKGANGTFPVRTINCEASYHVPIERLAVSREALDQSYLYSMGLVRRGSSTQLDVA